MLHRVPYMAIVLRVIMSELDGMLVQAFGQHRLPPGMVAIESVLLVLSYNGYVSAYATLWSRAWWGGVEKPNPSPHFPPIDVLLMYYGLMPH